MLGADLYPQLVDAFGRKHDYLRLSLTDRCNLRCFYCMPEEGVELSPKESILTFEEIERLTRILARMGARKVRLTGGEPTVRKGLVDLVARLAKVPGIEALGLTTNGVLLPDLAKDLRLAGLTTINISLDTLIPQKFERIARRTGHERVLAGIEKSVESGLITKVNVVVIPGANDDEIEQFVEFTRDRPIQVRFIEFMPFLMNGWRRDRVLTSQQIRDRLSTSYTLVPKRGLSSDVASEYEVEGHQGEIGFVSSVSQSFCGGCSRVRLTADGQFKTCLFLPPNLDLRSAMREGAGDEQLAMMVHTALQGKWKAHPDMTNWKQLDTLSMVQIGG